MAFAAGGARLETKGTCDFAFHEDAVPLFLEQLTKYLRTLRLDAEAVASRLRRAEEQVWTKMQ